MFYLKNILILVVVIIIIIIIIIIKLELKTKLNCLSKMQPRYIDPKKVNATPFT
jgi:hypothetical protein